MHFRLHLDSGRRRCRFGWGSCDNTNDILAQLIETLNWAMLAVIAVVATYLIFVALLDTANDGEAGGRRMNAP